MRCVRSVVSACWRRGVGCGMCGREVFNALHWPQSAFSTLSPVSPQTNLGYLPFDLRARPVSNVSSPRLYETHQVPAQTSFSTMTSLVTSLLLHHSGNLYSACSTLSCMAAIHDVLQLDEKVERWDGIRVSLYPSKQLIHAGCLINDC